MAKHIYVGDFVVYQSAGLQSRLLKVTEVTLKVVVAGGYRFDRLSGDRLYPFPVPVNRIARMRKADERDFTTDRINKSQEALQNYKVGETNLEQVEQFLRGSL